MTWISSYEPKTELGLKFLRLSVDLVRDLETASRDSKVEQEMVLQEIGRRLDDLEKENGELKKLVRELDEHFEAKLETVEGKD